MYTDAVTICEESASSKQGMSRKNMNFIFDKRMNWKRRFIFLLVRVKLKPRICVERASLSNVVSNVLV
jgi:hypothetical protein